MTLLSLVGLLKASGIATPAAGQSFRANAGGGPLPDGASMQQYVLGPLGPSSAPPDLGTVRPNYETWNWVIGYGSVAAPSRLAALNPTSFSAVASNIRDDFGTLRPGTVLYTPTVTLDRVAQTITLAGRIRNTRTVADHGAEGGGDAWHSFDLTFTFYNDLDFNPPQTLVYENLKVRTALDGQGDPDNPPTGGGTTLQAPTIVGSNAEFPDGFVDFLLAAPWTADLLSSGGAVEYRWSSDGVNYGPPDNALQRVASVGGQVHTYWAQIRVVSPYVSGWTGYGPASFTDPRPPV